MLQQAQKHKSQQEQEPIEQKLVLQDPQQEEILFEFKSSQDPLSDISEVAVAAPPVKKIIKRIRNPKPKAPPRTRRSSVQVANKQQIQTAQPSTSQEASVQRENDISDDDDVEDNDDVLDSDLNEDIFVRIDNGGYRCNVCQKTKLDRRSMLRHVVGQHSQIRPFKCNQCDKRFKRKYTLGIHQRSHELKQSDGYKCDKCSYHTPLKSSIYLHHYRMHTDEYRFTCEHCGKRCKFKRELVDHMVCHSDEQYMCDICGKLYKGVHLLRAHRRIHFDPYKFPCSLCKKKLATAESLQNHMKLHSRTFECDECGMKFACKPNLMKHRNVHTKEHAFTCPECGKIFADQATQKVHSLIHAGLRPYRCNVCGLGFTQRTPMMLHWRKKHPGETETPPPVILKNILKSIEEQNGRKAKLQNKE